MSLALDLAPSRAKVARAREHFETLDREVRRVVHDRCPYRTRVGQVDEDTGWCSIYLTQNNLSEPRLSVLFGDALHNLRCALNYIITALADASGVQLTTRHQFPIFDDRTTYRSEVESRPGQPVKRGPLDGINVGLDEVRAVQPYHLKPHPHSDRLWHVHRFNNADKHRELGVYMPLISGAEVRVYSDGLLVEQRQPVVASWESGREYEVLQVRFERPFPMEVSAEADVSMRVSFGANASPKNPRGHAVEFILVREMCDRVEQVVDLFATL